MIRTIKAGPVDYVHLETSFSAICPVDHNIDNYVIEVDYKQHAVMVVVSIWN